MTKLLEKLTNYLNDEEIALTHLSDESSVILDIGSGQVLTLNPTGTFLVEHLKRGPSSVDELALALCKEFEISLETAKVDCAEFIDQLSSTAGITT